MRHSEATLEDEELVEIERQALSKRRKKSKTRGRNGTLAEVVLRLLALKHMFNWSFDELHRELRQSRLSEFRSMAAAGSHRPRETDRRGA